MLVRLNQRETTLTSSVPVSLRKYAISYARPLVVEDATATICLQEIPRDGFVITLALFLIRKEVTVEIFSDKPFLDLAYVLAGSPITAVLAGFGKLALIKGKYNLFYTPAGSQTVMFSKGLHTVFIVKLDPFYLEKLATQHPEVKELIKRLETASDIGEMLPTGQITHEFEIIKTDMLNSRKTGTALDLELEAGILRLLSAYQEELASNDRAEAPTEEEAVVKTVIDYINNSTSQAKLPIKEITSELNISVRKLERIFKRGTGLTMLQCHQQEKMRKAVILLTKSRKPIKAISSELGYSDVSPFIRLFKKFYGTSPSAARDEKTIITMIPPMSF